MGVIYYVIRALLIFGASTLFIIKLTEAYMNFRSNTTLQTWCIMLALSVLWIAVDASYKHKHWTLHTIGLTLGISKLVIELNGIAEYFAVISKVAIFLEITCHVQAILLKRGHHKPELQMEKDFIITELPMNKQ